MTAQGIKSTYIMMEEPMLHHALNYRGTPTNRLGGPTDKCNPDITCAKDPLITGEPRKCPVPLIPRTYGKKQLSYAINTQKQNGKGWNTTVTEP